VRRGTTRILERLPTSRAAATATDRDPSSTVSELKRSGVARYLPRLASARDAATADGQACSSSTARARLSYGNYGLLRRGNVSCMPRFLERSRPGRRWNRESWVRSRGARSLQLEMAKPSPPVDEAQKRRPFLRWMSVTPTSERSVHNGTVAAWTASSYRDNVRH
jgi:hypothetical protein